MSESNEDSLNIFVLGLNEYNLEELRGVENAERYRFHGLIDLQSVRQTHHYDLLGLLNQCERTLSDFDGSIDAIIGFWDFPISPLVPVLAERYGTRGPSTASVLKCEHKHWSRLMQQEAIPDHIPDFQCIDPRDENACGDIKLSHPFWLKPVVAFGSQLAFLVNSADECRHAIEDMRSNIDQFARPFDDLLAAVELPDDSPPLSGYACVAEDVMPGVQCTLSGYVHDGEVQAYGVVDSLYYDEAHSFFCYRYPSRLPHGVQDRLEPIARDILRHIGFDDSAFNIEFFWDESSDRIWLLEVNSRISQSHSFLYERVDGASNHQVLLQCALGESPHFPHREGPCGAAGKFHIRRFQDGVVKRAPTDDELRAIENAFGNVHLERKANEGERLSDQPDRDSYSFRLADAYIAAEDDEALTERYHDVLEKLDFDIQDTDR